MLYIDIIILLTSAIILLIILQQEGSIKVRSGFYSAHQTSNGWIPPRPLVKKVDGMHVVILCSTPYTIEVLPTYALRQSIHSTFAELHPFHVVHLDHPIVSIDSGFLSFKPKPGHKHLKSSLSQRNRVFVVVTNDGSVTLYDSHFVLLWEKFLIPPELNAAMVLSASVAITPLRVHNSDLGMVVVYLFLLVNAQHKVLHLSLNGKDGSLRWLKYADKTQYGANSEHGSTLGNVNMNSLRWSIYQHTILKHLPYSWSHQWHSKLITSVFSVNTVDSKYQSRPHNHTSHKDISSHPSICLLKSKEGLLLFNPYTGEHIANIATSPGKVYADTNSDNVVEVISITPLEVNNNLKELNEFKKYDSEEIRETASFVHIQSGFPMQLHTVKQYPIANDDTLNFNIASSYMHNDYIDITDKNSDLMESKKLKTNAVVTVPPLVVQVQTLQGKVRTVILTLSSSGYVSAFDGKSNAMLWRIKTNANFQEEFIKEEIISSKLITEMSTGRMDSVGTMPQLIGYHIKSTNLKLSLVSKVLAVGDTRAVFIDILSGHQCIEFSLPGHPVAPVIVKDHNNDHINDLIITTNHGVFSYILYSHRSNNTIVIMLLLLVSFIIIILVCTLVMHTSNAEESSFIRYLYSYNTVISHYKRARH